MALWPTGVDPLAGLDPGQLGIDPFAGGMFDPMWVPGHAASTRRRLSGPDAPRECASSGVAGREQGKAEVTGEEGWRRHPTREPFVVGPAGWTRSIPCDFIEREKEYVLRADIPGCKKSEIHVEVFGEKPQVLRIGHVPGAEREKEDAEERGVFHRAERIASFRNRNLRLPDDADGQSTKEATYVDGVLEIVITKKQVSGRTEGRVLEIA